MKNARPVVIRVLLATLLVACSDTRTPSGLESARPRATSLAIAALASSMAPSGIDGFHFAAPIVPGATLPDDRDASLLDLLSVEICAWSDNACVAPPIRRFDATSSGPARLRVEDGVYHAVWKSGDDAVSTDAEYRIRVMASGGEVGHVGLIVRARGSQKSSGEDGAVNIVQGSSLPIGFVLEPGAGARATPAAARIDLAGGALWLDLPTDAVPTDKFLTAVRVAESTLPAGRPIVPGTVWDLGPDGLTFAKPVVLTMRFDLASVPAGVNPAELRIHKVVDGEYVQQAAGRVDLVNGTISATVDGFSIFVVVPRDVENLQDRQAPLVTSMGVRAGSMSTFANLVELSAGASNAPYTFRLGLTDDLAGVAFIDLRYISQTGRQVRFTCYTGAAPNSGSDTNGEWDCSAELPRYAEAGDWRPQFLFIVDRVNNSVDFQQRAAGFCSAAGTACLAAPPVIRVLPTVSDIAAPVLTSLQVSLSTEPRAFTNLLTIPPGATQRTLWFGFNAQDNLAGVGNGLFFDVFAVSLRGPNGQSAFTYPTCTLRTGTSLTGFWECPITLPAQAATGIWRLDLLRVPDRAGNGGWSAYSDYRLNAANRLCNRDAVCVDNPSIEVVGTGDNAAPLLQSFSISRSGAAVTTTLRVTDDISGSASVLVRYRSAETTQSQQCFMTRTTGSVNDGSWSCTITFPSLAATGSWIPTIELRDTAANFRFYTRRAADGFLCYSNPSPFTQVCTNFGDTELILR